MSQFQAFESEDIANAATVAGRPYQELIRRPGFSMGVYHLPVGGIDHQHPHASDEVYIVYAGKATLRVAGVDYSVGSGSVVSVDRGTEHGFTHITEDLIIMVLFAPPEQPET